MWSSSVSATTKQGSFQNFDMDSRSRGKRLAYIKIKRYKAQR